MRAHPGAGQAPTASSCTVPCATNTLSLTFLQSVSTSVCARPSFDRRLLAFWVQASPALIEVCRRGLLKRTNGFTHATVHPRDASAQANEARTPGNSRRTDSYKGCFLCWLSWAKQKNTAEQARPVSPFYRAVRESRVRERRVSFASSVLIMDRCGPPVSFPARTGEARVRSALRVGVRSREFFWRSPLVRKAKLVQTPSRQLSLQPLCPKLPWRPVCQCGIIVVTRADPPRTLFLHPRMARERSRAMDYRDQPCPAHPHHTWAHRHRRPVQLQFQL